MNYTLNFINTNININSKNDISYFNPSEIQILNYKEIEIIVQI